MPRRGRLRTALYLLLMGILKSTLLPFSCPITRLATTIISYMESHSLDREIKRGSAVFNIPELKVTNLVVPSGCLMSIDEQFVKSFLPSSSLCRNFMKQLMILKHLKVSPLCVFATVVIPGEIFKISATLNSFMQRKASWVERYS